MTWFAWRQFRIQAIAGAACLAVFLGALLLTWGQVNDAAASTGYTGCADGECQNTARAFLNQIDKSLTGRVYLASFGVLLGLPALVGVFWGAPMVARELESGTYRIVWNQTVSRRRWLLIKLAIGSLATVSGVGVLSLVLTRWARPIDDAHANLITPLVFPTRGMVPIGYALFAFALGVTVGLVLRKTLPTMAVTLALVVAVQLGAAELRPLIAHPVHRVTALTADRLDMIATYPNGTIAITGKPSEADAWELSNKVVTTVGGPEYHGPIDPEKCAEGASQTCVDWIFAQGLRQEETYVPASRFWLVQWRELAILIALTAALSLASLWWIRHRPT